MSGRAGRSGTEGNVFIQTFQPDHPVIKSIIVCDKEKFINWELSRRKQNFQPPFSSFISMIIQNKKEPISDSQAEWASLFDGKTFDGWHQFNKSEMSPSWYIENGEMIFDPKLTKGKSSISKRKHIEGIFG